MHVLNGELRLESLVWRASSWRASSGPGDLMLGNSVPYGNPDSALDSTFSYTLSYRSVLESLNGYSEIGVEPLLSFWVFILVV
jgi:hypothetical protein